jgi:hypothetical protein
MPELSSRWLIGDVEIPSRIVLAPMAGVSVQAFRRQGRRFGAGLVCSEMVSSCGLSYGNERTLGYLRISSDEHPLAVQIFGSEPERMAEAAKMVVAAGADIATWPSRWPAPWWTRSMFRSRSRCAAGFEMARGRRSSWGRSWRRWAWRR